MRPDFLAICVLKRATEGSLVSRRLSILASMLYIFTPLKLAIFSEIIYIVENKVFSFLGQQTGFLLAKSTIFMFLYKHYFLQNILEICITKLSTLVVYLDTFN